MTRVLRPSTNSVVDSGALYPDVAAAVERMAALRPLVLRSRDFFVGGGAPTESLLLSRTPVWNLRDGVTDRIAAVLPELPQNTVVDIDVVWMNANDAQAGDVALRAYWGSHTTGMSAAAVTNLNASPLIQAVPASGAYYRTRLARNVNVSRSMVPLLLIERVGSDAADTLAASFGVAAVLVSPVTPYAVMADDAVWCWFNEARLLGDAAAGKLYASYVTDDGSVAVSSLHVATEATAKFTLHSRLEVDDHDVPGMALLGDGNLIAFYSRHSITEDPIYWRATSTPGDVSTFGDEQTIALPGNQPCYPKPVVRTTDGRIYVFFRGVLQHDYIYSDDDGATWSTPAALFTWSPGWRGYVNLVANGNRVDFIVNDDNPNSSSRTNLYHCYLDLAAEHFYTTAGVSIEDLGAGGLTTSQLTKIYDYTSDGDAWGWDVQVGADGHPRCVFATFPGAASAAASDTNHKYKFGRWTGVAWVVSDVVDGGTYIIDDGGEWRYSGGLGLLSGAADVIYLSRPVNGQWEIERWTTGDGGATWALDESVTSYSRDKQFRPTTPEGRFVGCPEVAWNAGWYVSFSGRRFGSRLCYRPES